LVRRATAVPAVIGVATANRGEAKIACGRAIDQGIVMCCWMLMIDSIVKLGEVERSGDFDFPYVIIPALAPHQPLFRLAEIITGHIVEVELKSPPYRMIELRLGSEVELT
jgi:hypothetical protein